MHNITVNTDGYAPGYLRRLGKAMFLHRCDTEHLKIIGQRANPLDESWNAWTLVVCTKCKKLYEWQHHSDEQMHGGDLEITAMVTPDYLHHKYQLNLVDLEAILQGRKKARRFNRYTRSYVDETA
jgi:hypothetical protein